MLRLTQTTLIAAVGFGAVWIAAMASCSDEDPDNLLTTVATGTMATGGMGGTSTDGGGGAGADGGDGTGGNTGGTGGDGGQGGTPEEVINGCTSATASNQTGLGNYNIDIPGGTYCVRLSVGTNLTYTITPGNSRWIGGTIDPVTNVKSVDSSSPIYACSLSSPYENCPAVNDDTTCLNDMPEYNGSGDPTCSPPINFPAAGAYPWFDDSDVTNMIKGVIYVE